MKPLSTLLSLALVLGHYAGCDADEAPPTNFNQHAWLADFEQLKHEMSQHYANLEWAVTDRRMDLRQLSDNTEARLLKSSSDAEARAAIESFLRAFGDGHLRVEWPSGSKMPQKEQPSPGKQSICSCLRFRDEKLWPGIGYQQLDNFTEVKTADSKYFPIGILALPAGKKVGIIRLATFDAHPFGDLCETAVAELGVDPSDTRDWPTGHRVGQRVADLYVAAFERQLRALTGIDALVVDITGNGGGGDVCEPMARVLTPKHVQSPRIGFIRNPLWVKYITNHLEGIEEKSKQGHASPRQQGLIAQGADSYRKALAEARLPVNRDMMWENKQPDRSLVVNDLMFTSGTMPYLTSEELAGAPALDELFMWSRYVYHEGVYSGPLMVLVDDRTGSSSEEFAAILKDNGAATIIGSPTAGAGFGYYGTGIPTFLKNSGAEVKMSDGVRYRADGMNEVRGIEPDVLIPWRQNYSAYQKATHVSDALAKLMSR